MIKDRILKMGDKWQMWTLKYLGIDTENATVSLLLCKSIYVGNNKYSDNNNENKQISCWCSVSRKQSC